MKITTDQQGATRILRLHGRIVLGESAELLKKVLSGALLDRDCAAVVLDLTGVDYVDSTGLGELIGNLTLFKDAGKRLTVRNPGPKVLSLLKLARLDTIFPIEAVPSPGR